MTSDDTFWSQATAPRTPAEALRRARRTAANPGRPREPEPEASAIPDIGDASLSEYAALRSQLGVTSADTFVGLNRADTSSGFPGPRTGLTDDEVHALLPHLSTGERPVSGRQLDPAYQQAQLEAQQNTGLAVPTRYERS